MQIGGWHSGQLSLAKGYFAQYAPFAPADYNFGRRQRVWKKTGPLIALVRQPWKGIPEKQLQRPWRKRNVSALAPCIQQVSWKDVDDHHPELFAPYHEHFNQTVSDAKTPFQ